MTSSGSQTPRSQSTGRYSFLFLRVTSGRTRTILSEAGDVQPDPGGDDHPWRSDRDAPA
jgi:hypothetical protein